MRVRNVMRRNQSNYSAVCILLVFVVLCVAACQSTDRAGPPEPLELYATVPESIDDIPRITPEELKSMIDRGDPVVIVDTNPESFYEMEHIPGAVNIPWHYQGLEQDPELPKNILIVAYCACPHEEDSGDVALQMIADFGYRNIKLLLGGNTRWKELGYPMETAE